mmetsp:Transcript_36365/g.66618  ORF Transcript_36365/g.66618 Transcript_36365/m.66618 type:complete len:402 (+) Transcript_36365:22-1227(+)
MEQTERHNGSDTRDSTALQRAGSASETVSPDLVLVILEQSIGEDDDDDTNTHGGTLERQPSLLTQQTLSCKLSVAGLSVASEPTCVICYTNPREVTLEPCGHNKFCKACAAHFQQRCPLCRQNLVSTAADNGSISVTRQSSDTQAPATRPQHRAWPQSLRRRLRWFQDPRLDWKSWVAICLAGALLCVFAVTWGNCAAYQRNLGHELADERRWWLGDIESETWGRSIAIAVGTGAGARAVLLYCMWRRGAPEEARRLRRCGAVIFVISVLATLARSWVLDAHYLYHPRAYSIYRVPSACDGRSEDFNISWLGADNVEYCVDNFTSWSETTVYVATSASQYSPTCSTFSADSAVLDLWDCEVRLGEVVCPLCRPFGNSHLCDRLAWVIGAKFGALYRLLGFF